MTDVKPEQRCYLYSSDCPEGRIFKGADAIAAAKKDGWKDSPADLSKPKPAARKATGGGKKKATRENSA